MNFNCIFPSCNYKQNDIEEEEFLKHLKEEHQNEILDTAKKENMPIKTMNEKRRGNETKNLSTEYYCPKCNHSEYEEEI